MHDHVPFLILIISFCYTLFYFTCLALRAREGVVTPQMLAWPKQKLALIGFCEAANLFISFPAARNVAGALLPVISQVMIPMTIALSHVLLGKRFHARQLSGAVLVVLGVVFTVVPTLVAGGGGAGHIDKLAIATYASSYVFSALAVVLKEKVFAESREAIPGGISMWVVNSFGSLFQCMLTVPYLLATAWVSSGGDLVGYAGEGLDRLFSGGPLPGGERTAPWLPAAYICCNIGLNLSALALIKAGSALLTSIAVSVQVPLTMLAFALPLPYVAPLPFHGAMGLGVAILLAGIYLYRAPAPEKKRNASAT